MSKALLLIDFVNDNVAKDGKLAGKGYPAYCEVHGTLESARKLLDFFREKKFFVAHIRVGFSPDYCEQPANSLLFGAAKKFGAFKIGETGDEFYSPLKPLDNEKEIIKHRVSAFYGTPLELLLRNNNVSELFICGVATDLAVQAAARDAHDRDFDVTVVEDCCGAANEADHTNSLVPLRKIAKVAALDEVLKNLAVREKQD
jgi:nicotinamidase-related amidase